MRVERLVCRIETLELWMRVLRLWGPLKHPAPRNPNPKPSVCLRLIVLGGGSDLLTTEYSDDDIMTKRVFKAAGLALGHVICRYKTLYSTF